MRHLKSGRQLNRTASHRKAMLANLATSILNKERVITTVTKAKEVRSSVERLITYGKKDTNKVHAIRLVAKQIKDKTVIKKLFDDIAPGYKDREGGYTRIIKKGFRKGDNAELAIIELVGREGDTKRRRKKKKKSAPKASAPGAVKEKAAKSKKVVKNVASKEENVNTESKSEKIENKIDHKDDNVEKVDKNKEKDD